MFLGYAIFYIYMYIILKFILPSLYLFIYFFNNILKKYKYSSSLLINSF